MDPSHRAMPGKRNILLKDTALLSVIGCAILLIGCQRVNNDFTLSSASGEIASAELQLCRKNQPLTQRGASFKGQMAISCEGSGKIRVRLKDGSVASCHIGYVTPGMEQKFEFVIKDGVCGPAMKL
ncbi:hypothetical protein PbB2_01945 [Candidatus Phycosocius bacilliformis]|uniref:Lipoprotein n=1 Tax=Candidatus Phycosocius bacilliformis TaxID=1445552 RepID=A0A2P2EB43_9PROT|nr:hypothetical protein [Candidatus Phycosocius bacilliformis]GBF58272.1 hypothetical protein PbB2_01945 [Candidatus Phycosocius bacilliformis]